MSISTLNKNILKVSGDGSKKLLNGLITQDMDKISKDTPIYSLILNNKGRLLYTTIIYMLEEEAFALEIEPDLLMSLAKHIHKHDLTKKIEFNKVELFVAINKKQDEGFLPDPRHKNMPFRKLTDNQFNNNDLLEDYETTRLQLAIPENNDFIREKTMANELNAEQLNGICFKKGCYLGQELTSRTKHIKQPKNQLVCLDNTLLNINKHNCELADENNNKVGFSYSYNSKFVLAIIKRGTNYLKIKEV